jgi:hypothetical protein
MTDKQQRVRLPDAKPGQVFAYADNGNGSFTLTLVKAETTEPFPPGSLLKYMTKERDAEMSALAKGMKMPTPPEDED